MSLHALFWTNNCPDFPDGDEEPDGCAPEPFKCCKFCGKMFLVWKKTSTGWRLADREGQVHMCQGYDKKNQKTKDPHDGRDGDWDEWVFQQNIQDE